MKLKYQQLDSQSTLNSITDFWVIEPMFGVHWHYHPEVEICYVKQGSGHRIIGNSVERFEDGDLVLVGSNLPHCWITDEDFNKSALHIEVYVIHFHTKLFPSDVAEFSAIQNFLNQAKRGVKFNTLQEQYFITLLNALENSASLSKFLKLCELLQLMSASKQASILATANYVPEQSKKIESRIVNVCNYIQEHFKKPITLDELANIAHMNPASFSRFFKKNIGKSPINYLNEIRVNMACTKLLNTNDKAYQIAFDSGFNSMTHFNKLFKRYKGCAPLDYRK